MLVLLSQASGNGGIVHHGMWGDMWHYMWGGGMWIWLLVLAGVVFIVLLLFFVMQAGQTQVPDRTGNDLQAAKERLTKGEITPEEFDEIKKRIT